MSKDQISEKGCKRWIGGVWLWRRRDWKDRDGRRRRGVRGTVRVSPAGLVSPLVRCQSVVFPGEERARSPSESSSPWDKLPQVEEPFSLEKLS